jgi:diacylglycerol O-acyltransferase / wax synthase
MRRLSGADALMLRLDGGNAYNHTLKISILDPSTDPEGWSWPRMERMFRERTHLLPVLRQRYLRTPLGLHQPIWVDDPEFDLDSHVRRVVCPAPGGMTEFCTLVEQLYAQPLDHNRPLWQTWVVEGLEGGHVALVMLVHHAYTDGIGALQMLGDFYDTAPSDAPVAAQPWTPQPLPSRARRLGWALRDLPPLLRRLPATASAVRKRMRIERDFARSGRQLSPAAFDRSALAPFQGGLSRNRRFSCESFPLSDLREVRAAFDVTINDVFMACVAGSVRRLREHAGQPLDGPMVGTMPLALKAPAERTDPGNYSSMDYVWLHTEIADPMDRLRATSAAAKATKEHFAQIRDADITSLIEFVPGAIVTGFARANARSGGRFDPFKNIILSNVPGPREQLYLGRWRVDRWFSTGQLSHGATLNVTVWSYGDQFNLCVLADAVAVPDTWELVRGFRASLDELLAAARAAAAASTPASTVP